jgi:serpin B
VVKGNNAFALDLYRQLRNQEGNLFFSPYSTSTALAMTYVGAKGQTATEMSKVLHFTLEQDSLHPAFASLMGMLNTKDKQGFQLSIANRLWGQQGYDFLKPFKQLTQDNYGAALEEVDFINATEETRRTINKWVEQQTQEKIQNLIAPNILNSLTRIVLTNAIYFKGTWVKQFNPAQTKNQPFTVAPGQQVDVPMMFQGASVGYAEFSNLQVLELPYVGKDTSMVILLPKNVDGLAELEQQLTPENLRTWLSSIRYGGCPEAIQLPKFRLNSAFEFKQVLSKMGMASAFDDDGADFSGMNGRKDLFLANVIHKTFVDVNEFGTEAAASTAVRGELRCRRGTFRADRPFIFLIRHIQSGSILFMGRVVNPVSRPNP